MKKALKRLFPPVLLCALLLGCVETATAVDLYFPSNPTTGYSWRAEAAGEDVVEIQPLHSHIYRLSVDKGLNVLIWGVEVDPQGKPAVG